MATTKIGRRTMDRSMTSAAVGLCYDFGQKPMLWQPRSLLRRPCAEPGLARVDAELDRLG